MATLKHPSQASQPTALCLEVCATHRDQTVQFLLQILSERLWLRIYPDIFCWWWHHLGARASLCPEWSATLATSHPGMPSISKLGGQHRNVLSWGFLASAGWVFLFPHETCLLLSGSLGPPNLETRRFGFTKVASGFAFYGLPNPSCSVPVSAVLFRWSWQTSLVLRNFTSLPAGRVNNHAHWRTGHPRPRRLVIGLLATGSAETISTGTICLWNNGRRPTPNIRSLPIPLQVCDSLDIWLKLTSMMGNSSIAPCILQII